MSRPKEKREARTLDEFISNHSDHMQYPRTVVKDQQGNLWRLKCVCGKTWVGEDQKLGIEMGLAPRSFSVVWHAPHSFSGSGTSPPKL